jgi:hypothetical protein
VSREKCGSKRHSSAASGSTDQSAEQRDQKEKQEYVEQNPRNSHGSGGNAKEPENRGNKRHYEENYCPSQHGASYRLKTHSQNRVAPRGAGLF